MTQAYLGLCLTVGFLAGRACTDFFAGAAAAGTGFPGLALTGFVGFEGAGLAVFAPLPEDFPPRSGATGAIYTMLRLTFTSCSPLSTRT